MVEIGKDDTYNRVYSYPRILKLIETAYISISVLDRDGNVVAFAAFEDFPQGLRGMQDDRHYNYWEQFFKKAFKIDDFLSVYFFFLRLNLIEELTLGSDLIPKTFSGSSLMLLGFTRPLLLKWSM